ncbi:hypothetical protein [Bradyrhizobium sp. 141]|uniref:hypothetical protein n=1 Tax=Bradyrhizobium sp. 141 TaxID=2782617 RepID=UPI001FFBD454|nr:hypothetical protein [Bradyrhizobium sp. 141]MCK1722193.1 hypothetical protein [Bradyrhizobium sp. 141]
MASAWNYSSFMPSPTTKKANNNQCVIGIAAGRRMSAAHVKLAVCSILVRRTNLVHEIKQEADQRCPGRSH